MSGLIEPRLGGERASCETALRIMQFLVIVLGIALVVVGLYFAVGGHGHSPGAGGWHGLKVEGPAWLILVAIGVGLVVLGSVRDWDGGGGGGSDCDDIRSEALNSRVAFEPGADASVEDVQLDEGEPHSLVVAAARDQILEVRVDGVPSGVIVCVTGPGLADIMRTTDSSGALALSTPALPATQNYYVTLLSEDKDTSAVVKLTIPAL